MNTHTVNTHHCSSARGAIGGSVPCSRAPQSWYWRWRECCSFTIPTFNPCRTWDSNPQPLDYKSDSLTIRPRLSRVVKSHVQKHGFSYHCYADDTQLYLSFHSDDPTIAARISACLTDISCWMKDHHLQLNLAKTELLVVSANPSLDHNFTFQLGSSTITPSKTARNLGVVIDDKLNFSDHIAKTARSCRFALYNIRNIRPFLSEHVTQHLVQALVLSRLDYCNALLAGLPANSIKPLQLIQNAVAILIFNEPKRMHVTPLFINLHWLPIAARIKFKALMFAYRTTTGSAPLYLNSLLQTYVPLEAWVLQVNDALFLITFTDFFINCSHLVEWPAQLNPSSWILTHLQEMAKNTSLPSLFDPLTLALSILILFYLSVFFLFKRKNLSTCTALG